MRPEATSTALKVSLLRRNIGVTGHPHNGGGGDPKKLPVILGGVEKVLGGATPPRGDPPHNGGGESNDMRGSPRGSQNLEISSGSPPEWGGES